jgi:hypothetical protein
MNRAYPPVGLAANIPLSRRVQLAVLAHIRHTHTRYDKLLRETSYANARKAVASLCLDFLVKWRGDEETGRDQLDEILREVVVISDSDSEDGEEADGDDQDDSSPESIGYDMSDNDPGKADMGDRPMTSSEIPQPPRALPLNAPKPRRNGGVRAHNGAPKVKSKSAGASRLARRRQMKAQNEQTKNRAVRDEAWHQAVERQKRLKAAKPLPPITTTAPLIMARTASSTSQPWRVVEPAHVTPEPQGMHYGPLPSNHSRHHFYSNSSRMGAHQNGWESADYNGRPPHALSPPSQQLNREYREYQDQSVPHNNVSRPVVGPGHPHSDSVIRREMRRDLNLQDHLVRSIEPPSPAEETRYQRHLAGQLHLAQHRPDPQQIPGYQQERTYVPLRDASPTLEARLGMAHLVTSGNASFGRPMFDPDAGRIPLPSDRTYGSRSVFDTQLRAPSQGKLLVDGAGGPGLQPLQAYRDDDMLRDDGYLLRSETRPIWIEDDDALRSRSRPILIRDLSAQPERSGARHHPQTHARGGHADHPIPGDLGTRRAPIHVLDDDVWHLDGDTARRAEEQPGEPVEFFRVSNKFPRRYEPQATPSTPAPGLQTSPEPHRSHEQVVRRVEESMYAGNRASGHADGYPAPFARRERVVGIEYIPTDRMCALFRILCITTRRR